MIAVGSSSEQRSKARAAQGWGGSLRFRDGAGGLLKGIPRSIRPDSALRPRGGLALGLLGVYDAGLFVWGGYGISTFVGVVGVRMGLVLRARRRLGL